MEDNKNIYEISLLELFTVLVKRRWFIAKIAAWFAVLSIIYSLIAAPVYNSQMKVMTSGGEKGMGDAMAMLAAAGIGAASVNSQSDTVVGIIKSPAVLDRVIKSKKLLTREEEGFSIGKLIRSITKKEMEPRSLEMTRNALSKKVSASADVKTGLISLSVGARTPEFSQEMTQAVFDETQEVMRTLATSPSAQSKLVLEQLLAKSEKELEQAEKELSAYNAKSASEGDTPADVTSLSVLQSAMLKKELELKAAKKFGTAQNPKVKQLQAEYDAMRRRFEEQSGTASGNVNESFDYTAKLRDYKLKEKTYNLLLARYENAKITEDDAPLVIQAVGAPTLPEKRSKPQRKKIVVLATVLGIFIGIFAAFAQYFTELGMADKETAGNIAYIKNALKGDLETVRKKFLRKA